MRVTVDVNFEPADIREEILDAAELELRAIGLEMERDIVAEIDRMGLNVDGDLRKSVTSEVRRELLKVKLEAGPGAKHSEWVHDGTKPHWAPRAPIERWVRKKLAISEPVEIKRVTFLVQRKIAMKGTEPKPYLADVFALYRVIMADRVRDRILREVA